MIVLARGGGSLEDLAAFNSERVARAIAGSSLPVVSAIGHETDFTIADFVADLRAPTPSAAAELITERQHKVAERVTDLAIRLERAARFRVLQARQQVDSLHAERAEWRISSLLQRLGQRLDNSVLSLERCMREQLRADRRAADGLAELVMRHDPRRLLGETRERLASSSGRLDRAAERLVQALSAQIHGAEARLQALSPLKVLQRGYALVHDGNGVLVRSVAQLGPGEVIQTRVSDGSFASRIEKLDSTAKTASGREEVIMSVSATPQAFRNWTAFAASLANLPLDPATTGAAGLAVGDISVRRKAPKAKVLLGRDIARIERLDRRHDCSRTAEAGAAARERRYRAYAGGRLPCPHAWIRSGHRHFGVSQSLARQRHQALRRRRFQIADAVELEIEEEIERHAEADATAPDPAKLLAVVDKEDLRSDYIQFLLSSVLGLQIKTLRVQLRTAPMGLPPRLRRNYSAGLARRCNSTEHRAQWPQHQ